MPKWVSGRYFVCTSSWAQVSTDDQDDALQTDAREEADCERIYSDKAIRAKEKRSGIQEDLDYGREGDTLVVWRLEQLSLSLKHLVETINRLEKRGVTPKRF